MNNNIRKRGIPYMARCTGFAALLVGLPLSSNVSASLLLAAPENLSSSANHSVFVYGAAGTTGTVSNGNGFSQSFTTDANGVVRVQLLNADYITVGNTVENKGFFITSDDPISAHWLNRRSATTDMTYLHDIDSLGTEFYHMGMGAGHGKGSQLTLVASQDNTQVEITPTVNTLTGQTAGTPFTVTLNAGQTVMYNGGTGDLTGSKVVSDKPIALFGGNQCTNIPAGVSACDHIVSQLPSVDNYSKSWALSETPNSGTAGNLVRVLASQDNTQVALNGVVVATINAGEFHEIPTLNDGGIVETDKPALLGQYQKGQGATLMNSDPAFSFITGTDQWLDEYVLSTPVGADAFPNNWLSVVIETSILNTLLLDNTLVNAALFNQINTSIYSYANLDILAGIHTIKASDPFQVLMAGVANYDSYLTIAGATFSPGASPDPCLQANPPSFCNSDPDPDPDPIPEPATLALMGLGLAGISWKRRRKAA